MVSSVSHYHPNHAHSHSIVASGSHYTFLWVRPEFANLRDLVNSGLHAAAFLVSLRSQ